METIVFEVELKDGRIFRIFCANSTQKEKFIQSYYKVENLFKSCKVITNGIHTVKQWNEMIKTL